MPQLPRLNPVEARLLGVLVEKALTTPDQYPLTLNALIAGANQRSNRDPVTSLREAEVLVGLDGLRAKQLAGGAQAAGARVERFRHNGEASLGVSTPELAVLAELLLRGAQAPGELRARVARMAPVETLAELEELLRSLDAKGYVRRRDPAPGSRAPRYGQLLGAEHAAPERTGVERFEPLPRAPGSAPGPAPAAASSPGSVSGNAELPARVAALEAEVGELRRRLGALEDALGA